jgi:hypothetical protein
MPTYQNVGPEYRRNTGEVVTRGAYFEATPREHERFQRRKTRFFVLLPDGEALPGDTGGAGEPAAPDSGQSPQTATNSASEGTTPVDSSLPPASPATEALPDWPVRMVPATYLKLHPNGPNAELARRILARGAPVGDQG